MNCCKRLDLLTSHMGKRDRLYRSSSCYDIKNNKLKSITFNNTNVCIFVRVSFELFYNDQKTKSEKILMQNIFYCVYKLKILQIVCLT